MNLEEINNKFNKELKKLTHENANSKILLLGYPSYILQKSGIDDKPIRFYGNKLLKKARKHGFNAIDLENLPKAIASPLAVFNGNRENSFALLTKLKIKEDGVLVIIEIGKGDADINFNVITSTYPKKREILEKWINAGKAIYINKKGS